MAMECSQAGPCACAYPSRANQAVTGCPVAWVHPDRTNRTTHQQMNDAHMTTRVHERTQLMRTNQPSWRRTTLTCRPGLTRHRRSNTRDGAHKHNEKHHRMVASSAPATQASWTPEEKRDDAECPGRSDGRERVKEPSVGDTQTVGHSQAPMLPGGGYSGTLFGHGMLTRILISRELSTHRVPSRMGVPGSREPKSLIANGRWSHEDPGARAYRLANRTAQQETSDADTPIRAYPMQVEQRTRRRTHWCFVC